jgi:hypothetical protein
MEMRHHPFDTQTKYLFVEQDGRYWATHTPLRVWTGPGNVFLFSPFSFSCFPFFFSILFFCFFFFLLLVSDLTNFDYEK